VTPYNALSFAFLFVPSSDSRYIQISKVESFITPRLSSFDKENTQAPSALLELFHAWTTDEIHLSFLVDFSLETLPKIFDCLIAKNIKPSSQRYSISSRTLSISQLRTNTSLSTSSNPSSPDSSLTFPISWRKRRARCCPLPLSVSVKL
jgi:hypothetical protein